MMMLGWLVERVSVTDIAVVAGGLGVLAYAYRYCSGATHEKPKPAKSTPSKTDSVESAAPKDLVARLNRGKASVAVFWGSQMGTAKDCAACLAKEAARLGLKGMALDADEVDWDSLASLAAIPQHLALFCVATYGEGEPTDNAQGLFEFLTRETGAEALKGLNFAVFGLGNKTYEHYNAMGKFVNRRLGELGATRLFDLGLGDDEGNLDEDFLLWRESLWPAIAEKFNIDANVEEVDLRQYRLRQSPSMEQRLFTGEMSRRGSYAKQRPPYESNNPFLAPLLVNRELHGPASNRSCRHIELSLDGSSLRYQPGDHVAVYPRNDAATVVALGELLGTDLEAAFALESLDADSRKKSPFPCPCTFRTALSHYVDIASPLRTHVLKALAKFTANADEAALLRLMGSASDEGRRRYANWIKADRRAILDLLRDLPSCRPPIDLLLDLLPRLQPRYYSISSSLRFQPKLLSITAVHVAYTTRLNRPVNGVATTYLRNLQPSPSTRVPIYIRRSGFRLPRLPSVPIIMVGPGTGIAPFRSFLQERSFYRSRGKAVGETILFFGCRRREEDYLYREELAEWLREGTLTSLHEAFSREGAEKVYVQHLIRREAPNLYRLIRECSAHVYVCGDAKAMAKEVSRAFVEVLRSQGAMEEEEAKQIIKAMETQKRYQADVW